MISISNILTFSVLFQSFLTIKRRPWWDWLPFQVTHGGLACCSMQIIRHLNESRHNPFFAYSFFGCPGTYTRNPRSPQPRCSAPKEYSRTDQGETFTKFFSIQNIRAWFHSWFLDNVLAAIAQFFAPNFYCIPKHLEPHQSKETHWRHVTCGSLFSSKIFIIIKYMETMTLQVSLGKGAPKSDKSLLQQTHFTSFTL